MLRRIVRHAEYQSFTRAARTIRLPHFFVPVLSETAEVFGYGITISGRIGNAVRRNLLRRRIKAWFWEKRHSLPGGHKANLIALPGACELDWPGVCAELERLVSALTEPQLKA